MAHWKLVTTSPFEVVAQCPQCGMYYKTFLNYVAAHASQGSLMLCSGYINAPGCGLWHELPYPMPFDMATYLAFSAQVNPSMIFLSTPIMRPKAPQPMPPQPSLPKVHIQLVGGHCFEEEDDVYNDDLYILFASRDSRGRKYTGSSGLISRIDGGDDFRFDPSSAVVYSGTPGEWLHIGFVAMESEDSHNSERIQRYWRAAEFAASYIPEYGEFIAYAIKGINLSIKYFDKDDRLAVIEVACGPSDLAGMKGYITSYEWNFKGCNNMSNYRYRIDYKIEVG